MDNNLSVVKDNFKELPNNIEAEQAVIGSILVSNEFFDEINLILSSNNFYDPIHQKIFSAIENLIFRGMLANPITLKSYFEDEKDALNVPDYLVKVTKFSTSIRQALEYSKIIYETSKIEIKPSMIQPVEEIKALGKFKVKISLHSEVDAEITIDVQSAESIQ